MGLWKLPTCRQHTDHTLETNKSTRVSANECVPIVVTPLGIVSDVKAPQYANAKLPIVTPLGIVSDVKAPHS